MVSLPHVQELLKLTVLALKQAQKGRLGSSAFFVLAIRL